MAGCGVLINDAEGRWLVGDALNDELVVVHEELEVGDDDVVCRRGHEGREQGEEQGEVQTHDAGCVEAVREHGLTLDTMHGRYMVGGGGSAAFKARTRGTRRAKVGQMRPQTSTSGKIATHSLAARPR